MYLMEQKGVNLLDRTMDRRTALHLAAQEGHLNVVDALLTKNVKFVGATDANKMVLWIINRHTFPIILGV